MEQITEIPLDQIRPFPGNRKIGGFDQAKLEQLAESIRAVGVQQPAVVRRVPPDGFELVAGERRWRAARLAGLETLPCVVRDLDDLTVLKIHTIENLQREDVHPLDESDGFRRLLDVAGFTAEQVAHELGKSVSYVYQRLKLQELVPKARALLEEGAITAGHAIQIARLAPDQQVEVMKMIGATKGTDGEINVGVRELASRISYAILMNLSDASFKRDDANLVPEAGACTTCQKRTGYSPALFEDIGEDDRCTDRKCFARKLDAQVAARLEEFNGKDLLLVRGEYDHTEKEPAAKQPGLHRWQWQECKKKDAGAQRALILSGLGRGRLLWAIDTTKRQAPDVGVEEDEDPEYQEAMAGRRREEEARKADVERRKKELHIGLYHAVIEASLGRELDVVGVIAEAVCFGDNYRSGESLYALEGWKVPEGENDRDLLLDDLARRIREATPSEQIRLMLRLVIANDCQVWDRFRQTQPYTLYAACDVLGIAHPELPQEETEDDAEQAGAELDDDPDDDGTEEDAS